VFCLEFVPHVADQVFIQVVFVYPNVVVNDDAGFPVELILHQNQRVIVEQCLDGVRTVFREVVGQEPTQVDQVGVENVVHLADQQTREDQEEMLLLPVLPEGLLLPRLAALQLVVYVQCSDLRDQPLEPVFTLVQHVGEYVMLVLLAAKLHKEIQHDLQLAIRHLVDLDKLFKKLFQV